MKINNEINSNIYYINNLLLFILKSIIFVLSIYFVSLIIVPSFPKIPDNERNRLLIVSFIQNPHILYKLSVLKEDAGDISNSILFMESAIGLLEMNGASNSVIERYNKRLITIRLKLK